MLSLPYGYVGSAAQSATDSEVWEVCAVTFFTGPCHFTTPLVLCYAMKADIHPKNYRKVIFEDVTSGERFLIGSTIATKEMAAWTDNKEYPTVKVEISSASHPFYTGKETVVDTAGRVEKFKRRAAAAQAKASNASKKK